MGSSNTEGSSSNITRPWKPQGHILKSLFNQAFNTYQNINAKAPNDFTAQMTPQQLSVFQNMMRFGNNSKIAENEASMGQGLANSGAAGVQGALSGLAAFDPSATNNTQNVLQGARDYVSGMDIPGAVQAAMRDAVTTARDTTIPGIDIGAAASGNTNSSRAGLAMGLVQRGLAEKAADLSSNLYNSGYSTGANMAQNRFSDNNALTLSGLNSQGSLGNQASSLGLGAMSNSIVDKGRLLDMAQLGASGKQQANQLDLQNQLQQYQAKIGAPFDAMKQLYSIVGANNWGSQSHGEQYQQSNPSLFQTIGGLMGAGGSLFGKNGLNWLGGIRAPWA